MDKQKIYNCQKCKKNFLSLLSLKIHTKYFHKNKYQTNNQSNQLVKSKSSTQSKCKLRSKIFSNTANLNRHISVHEKQKKFQCQICDKRFGYLHHLSDHIQSIHQKLKPHQCSFCAKSFSQKGNLKRHKDMVHMYLRQHVCQICNKRFSTNQTLKIHVECVHEKIRKHACPKCNKRFGQKTSLRKHMTRFH